MVLWYELRAEEMYYRTRKSIQSWQHAPATLPIKQIHWPVQHPGDFVRCKPSGVNALHPLLVVLGVLNACKIALLDSLQCQSRN
jgi:hypothetical protein